MRKVLSLLVSFLVSLLLAFVLAALVFLVADALVALVAAALVVFALADLVATFASVVETLALEAALAALGFAFFGASEAGIFNND